MMHFIKTEINEIWQTLKAGRNEAVIIVSAIIFCTIDFYHPILNEWFSSFLFYALFPILVILFVLKKNPLDFGLRLGNIRVWGIYVVIICLAAAVLLYIFSSDPSLKTYYNVNSLNLFNYFLTTCVMLASQEFLFRGFLLFGLREKFKELSIFLQMIPFVLLHIGKPEAETLSTIFTGLLFGYVAYRGKSYWPVFIIHLFINVYFVALVN